MVPTDVDPLVGAVLVTRRRPEQLGDALARLGAQTRPVHRLVVANVEADPVSMQIVESWRDEHRATSVEIVDLMENVGPAGAVATGVEHLLRDRRVGLVLLLEDDDPLPGSSSIDHLVRSLATAQELDGAVVGVGFHGARFDARRARLTRPPLEVTGAADVDYLAGGHCPLTARGIWEQAGGYDPSLFFGFEELDFGLRVRDAGGRLLVVAGARPESLPPPVGPGLPAWSWRRYYSLRNLLVILRRRRHRASALRVALVRGVLRPLVSMPRHPALAATHLRWNMRAIVDAYRGRLGRTLEPSD